MLRFSIRRFFEAAVVLLIVSMFIFFFVRLLPGSPAQALYGEQFLKMTKTDQLRIEENLGLHDPLVVQYLKWLQGIFHGDFGHSYTTGVEVKTIILEAIRPTISLTIVSFLLTILLSITIGIYTGLKRYSSFDYITTIVSLLFMSLPSFWLALILLLIFSVHLQWFPSAGMGNGSFTSFLSHVFLPALVLALAHIGYWIRLLRNHVTIANEKPFIRALIARGIPKRTIIFKHVLRNASLPFLSYMGVALSFMLAGSAVVETIFSWPGIGLLTMNAAIERDYPVIIATTLLCTFIVIVVTFCSDLLSACLDPRLRRNLLEQKENIR
ncbi:ABC transporter permease [Massilibacterium senegalense]|uniref:ABC transporter permease n=1 Tax=Massilibacterium senegalense TaxID=1632858 RepID=UPI000783D902|nr:ABC transporter permease [Massilibacterium senegalense]